MKRETEILTTLGFLFPEKDVESLERASEMIEAIFLRENSQLISTAKTLVVTYGIEPSFVAGPSPDSKAAALEYCVDRLAELVME